MKKLLPLIFISCVAIQGYATPLNGSGDVIGIEPTSLPNWDAKIYPNPNNGVFSIMVNGNSGALDVLVFNIIGEKVYELQILGDHGAKIDLSGLEKGLYVVQIVDEKRSEIVTRRMHIE